MPIDVASFSPLAKDDLFLCAIFGGLISGIGSGLAIRFGGAMDGIEVLAVVFAKKLSLTVGTFVMIYNMRHCFSKLDFAALFNSGLHCGT